MADPKTIYPDGTIWVHRYKQDGRRKWETLSNESHAPGCGMTYHLARSIAKIREGELGLQKPVAVPIPITAKPIRAKITDAADAYIADLYREKNLTPRTIKDKRFELNRWLGWTTKQHIEELTRADLLAFRDRLRSEGLAEWTVQTNLTSVVTMLKRNPLKQVIGLLKAQDWPEIEDTLPEPYTVEEVLALQSVADAFERLVIRFFVGTGCREQEVAHVEWADINWIEKTVWIHAKPKWSWKPKTKAGTRVIPLSDALVRDLRKLKETSDNTLVFPAPRGGVEAHFLRILQDLGDEPGVTNVKCHRFRDTYITDKVQENVDLLTLRKWVGHTNLETLKLYAEVLRAKDQRARDAPNRQDRYTLRAVAVAAD